MVAPYQKWEYIMSKPSINTVESDPDYLQFLEKEEVCLCAIFEE